MLVSLDDATPHSCGGKAATLGRLHRAGFRVPDGFVVPFSVYRSATDSPSTASIPGDGDGTTDGGGGHGGDGARVTRGNGGRDGGDGEDRRGSSPGSLRRELERGLARLGGGPVAVRSSASDEDTVGASAAGQYESFLGLADTDDVLAAVSACWASAHSRRATAYRRSTTVDETRPADMAVLVQRQIDAEASGVMFTPSGPHEPTVIDASWGLGTAVVEGTVTPDAFRVDAAGTVQCRTGTKLTRVDRTGHSLVTRDVPAEDQQRQSITDDTARDLAALGHRVSELLGGPQDIEWALADGQLHLLQARPVTATPVTAVVPITATPDPAAPVTNVAASATAGGPADRGSASGCPTSGGSTGDPATASPLLTGIPGSAGSASGPVRIVRGLDDFGDVRPGDILVCPFTDPAWTPLLGVVAGVVTETGGALSHAAIVARERGIPAVLGIGGAMARLRGATRVTVDGTAGTVTATRGRSDPLARHG